MTTTAGGGISAPHIRGLPGAWLLELDLGGQPWRIASREVSITSREHGGAVVFRAGLVSPIDLSSDAESASVLIRGDADDTWAASRRQLGPLNGRPFKLRRWWQGALEDSHLALQGVVEQAIWGTVEEPAALQLGLRRSLRAVARTLPTPQQQCNNDTWPVRALYPQDEGVQGSYYPIIIGHPGSAASGSSTALPTAFSPGLLVEGLAHPTSKLLIAGHRVHATTVEVWDMSAQPPRSEQRTVHHDVDLLGQEIAYTDFVASTLSALEGVEWLIGWDRRAGRGGGMLHGGELIQGLGDLLIWGAETQSEAVHDHGEMESRRAALNRFVVDTVINKPVNWDDWLKSNVLDYFDLEEADSPRGLYYRERVYRTDASQVRARLTTTPGGSGIRVERVGGIEDGTDDIHNEITMNYEPIGMSTSAFRRLITIGPVQGKFEYGTLDTRHGASLACFHSRAWYGHRPKTFASILTSDAPTVQLVAQKKVDKHALPPQFVSYQGGPELADLRIYDTVELDDVTPGAHFLDDLALVWDLRIEDRDTFTVVLRVPTDPLRLPTLLT